MLVNAEPRKTIERYFSSPQGPLISQSQLVTYSEKNGTVVKARSMIDTNSFQLCFAEYSRLKIDRKDFG